MQPSIDVLVATFNGERFLKPLIESLLAQSIPVSILIRDDGSSDTTPSIIGSYVREHPGRIRQVIHDGTGCGAARNFSKLLAASDARYVMLADQDDIWDLDKVSVSLAAMCQLEGQFETDTPLLTYTDLRVVDEDMRILSPSLFDYQGLRRSRHGIADLLGQNIVTGCTLMLNRALCEKATPVPDAAVMHDWWIALIASSQGHIAFIDRATLSYRQHGTNTLGAQQGGLHMMRRYYRQLFSRSACASLVGPLLDQAAALLATYGASMTAMDRHRIGAIAQLRDAHPLSRVATAIKLSFRKHGLIKNIAFLWALLFAKFSE